MKKIYLITIIVLFSQYANSQSEWSYRFYFSPFNVNVLTGESSNEFRLSYKGFGSLSYHLNNGLYYGGKIFSIGSDAGFVFKTLRFKDHLIPVSENEVINWREDSNPDHTYNDKFFFGDKTKLALNYFNISPGFIINTNVTQIKINFTVDILLWSSHKTYCKENDESYSNIIREKSNIQANNLQYGLFIGLGLPDLKYKKTGYELGGHSTSSSNFNLSGLMLYYKVTLNPLFSEGNGNSVFMNTIGVAVKI